MSMEYRQQHIDEMLKWSLDKKIAHAIKRIVEFTTIYEGAVYVSFSGGKDSTVLLDLVRRVYPSAIAVFSNTTNEFTEILDFIKTTSNVIWLKPKVPFTQTVKEYGFPLIGKLNARKINTIKHKPNTRTKELYVTGVNGKGEYHYNSKLPEKWMFLTEEPFDVTNKCCDILKKEPFKRFEKEHKLKPIVGTQAEESSLRRKTWLDQGCNSFSKGNEVCRPLSVWTEDDIWEYIRLTNLPYSKIYDPVAVIRDGISVKVEGELRTGCEYCAYGIHLESKQELNRFERSKLRKPKRHAKMMSLTNNGVTFAEALDKIGVKH